MNFQVHLRALFVYAIHPSRSADTYMVRFMPQLHSCEQGCPLLFMFPAGKAKHCEIGEKPRRRLYGPGCAFNCSTEMWRWLPQQRGAILMNLPPCL